MFAPALGIVEDPACGSAVAALAALRAQQIDDASGDFRWSVDHGVGMGRPSRIHAVAVKRAGSVCNVQLSGGVRIFARGQLVGSEG